MSELRWNPLLGTYTMVSAKRQNRPNMPKDWCPFCPGENNVKVPSAYDVFMYKNDFPTLSQNPESLTPLSSDSIYKQAEAYGKCEVILYSSDHKATMADLSVGHIQKIVDLWVDRTAELKKDKTINYIFIFENRGEEVGVTMPHPHGQIYGYSFVPLKLKTELDNCKNYFEKTGRNLLLDINKQEKIDGKRVLIENDTFLCYIPYFTDYPYGIYISAKSSMNYIDDLNEAQRRDLATILKDATGMLDSLFDKTFPYMMCIHQGPVNSKEYADSDLYYNFHIEFYPPLRAENTIKWYASSEMGAWAAANTRLVEETAIELKNALIKFKQNVIC